MMPPRTIGPLRSILVFLCFFALSAPLLNAAPLATLRLPGPARSLSAHSDGRTAVAAMSLNGTAFLGISPTGLRLLQHEPEWNSTHAVALQGGGFLLADRFGFLRHVKPESTSSGRWVEAAKWDTESLPVHLTLKDNRLYVSSGSAGMLLYEWAGGAEAPHLRSRFPFVDYSKQTYALSNERIFLADNYDTGLQIFSIKDPMRPLLLKRFQFGYVEGVEYSPQLDMIAVQSRNLGVKLLKLNPGDQLFESHLDIPLDKRIGPRGGVGVSDTEWSTTGDLLTCQGAAGAILYHIEYGNGAIRIAKTSRLDLSTEAALSCAFIPGTDRILVATEHSSVLLLQEP